MERRHSKGVAKSSSTFVFALLGLVLLVGICHSVNASTPLVAPVISVGPATIDTGQSSTLATTTSFSGGTSPYVCQWLQKAPGTSFYSSLGGFFSCNASSLPSVSTGPLSTVGAWHFLLQVTDSSDTPVTVNSAPATVTVNPALSAPVISASPGVVDTGQSSALATTASFSGGTSPYACQWLVEAPEAGSFSSLGSSFACTTSSLPTVSTGTLGTVGTWEFELQVTDGASVTVNSAPATVTVNPALSAPVISASPGVVDTGQSSALATTASFSGGTSPYACQWLVEAPEAGSFSSLGSSFACTTSSLPTVSTGTLSTVGTWEFELRVTDGASVTVNSAPATVTVNPALSALSLTLSPSVIDTGQTAIITATVTWSGGTSTYSVTLYEGISSTCSLDTTAVSSKTAVVGTSTTLFTASLTSTTYYCAAVTDGAAVPVTVATPAALFTFNPALTATISPSSPTIDSGQSITLTVLPSQGTPPYSYQWYTGSSCASASAISGQTSSSYTASPTSTATYSVNVTDSSTGTPVGSYCATVTVTINPPLAATISPASSTIDRGQYIKLTAEASEGTFPYSYQWYTGSTCANANAISGGTSSSYTASPTSTITYSVKVTDNSAGTPAASVCASATVTVNPALTATISPSSPKIDSGQSVVLTAVPSGGTPSHFYQWYSGLGCVGASALLGQTSSSFFTGTLTTTTTYSVNVTDSGVGIPGASHCASLTVTVASALTAPVISAIPTATNSGKSSALATTASFSGGTSPYACQWLVEAPEAGSFSSLGSSFACTTSSLPTVSTGTLSTVGTWEFELRVTDGASVTVNSAPATVTVNPALSAPVISASPGVIDTGKSSALATTASFSGGTSPYVCQWLQKAPETRSFSPFGSSFSCNTSSVTPVSTGILSTLGVWSFELRVTDGASVTVNSAPATVAVNPALSAPVVSASPGVIDIGQSSALNTTVSFAGGTPTYTCQWFEESPTATSFIALGASFTAGCAPSSKPSASTGALTAAGIWSFELQVTDSASSVVVSSPATLFVSDLPATFLTLSCNQASVVVGSAVACKATVWGTGSAPTGTVTLSSSSSGTFSGTSCTLSQHKSYSACSVRFTPTAAVSSVTLTASYGGDSKNFRFVGTYSLAVTMKATKTTVSCRPKSAAAGATTIITCTARVTGYSPTGTVSWLQINPGSVSLDPTACTLSQGTCLVTTTGSTSGRVTMIATYVGDSNNQGSSQTTTLTIRKASTVTTVSCTPSPFGIGTPITCTATVSGGYPSQTGTVTFTVSGKGSVTSSSNTCTLSSGSCSVTVTATATGSLKIKAVYRGDSNNLKSSRTLVLKIT